MIFKIRAGSGTWGSDRHRRGLTLPARGFKHGVPGTARSYSACRSLVLDSHQFIKEFLIVLGYPEDVLLILFGQGAAVFKQDE